MRKKLPEIKESVYKLKVLLNTEKDARRKERIHMLYLFRTGQAKTRISAAQLLSVHRKTISCWLDSYELGGLDCMLHIGTKPNHKLSIPIHILHSLKRRLRGSNGFKSYKSIQQWLQKRYSLYIPYSTVHGIVRYRLKAKLKVGRKSHVKKDQQKVDEFRKNISQTISYVSMYSFMDDIRLFCQDESRLGLLPIHKRKITLPGVKPVSKVQYDFDYYYLYGAADPRTGDTFFLELPYLDTECFQVYLDEFSKAYDESFNILLLDRGTFHRSARLKIPSNIALIFIPPYSPELNPIERLWEDIKDEIADEIYSDIEALKKRVASVLDEYSKAEIRSISGYPYLMEAIKHAIG